ncbi:MAG: hypothetical protein J7496_15875 [Novosphingobium sp.]|nr:hypothetical protein [Novosphingobium sp.]MBO9603980.1 hypothetical protein [Novosphingobium sp.]
MSRALLFLACLLSASPALAGQETQVPEGSALTLFALGAIGVIVGRKGAMRPKDRPKDQTRKEP